MQTCREIAAFTQANYDRMFPGTKPLDIVTAAVKHAGAHGSICPEALEDMKNEADEWGWETIVPPGVNSTQLRMAYNCVMASFRAMLEPIGGW